MSLPSSPEALQIRARILHRHRRRISFNAGHDDWTQDGRLLACACYVGGLLALAWLSPALMPRTESA